ncbi:MAG: hypothetical protein AAF597_10830, partial [Bacteroidota bacterium]
MLSRHYILKLALFCAYFLGAQYLEAQSIRLRAEITQLRSNYRKSDHRGPDITWKWDGTVNVDGITFALNDDCYHKRNGSKNSQSFNRTETLIDRTFNLPGDNGNRGALDLCEDIVFTVELENFEDDRGGTCSYNGNGNIFQNDDDDRRRITYTYSMFSVDAGTWRTFDVDNGSRYAYTIRFRYDLVDPIQSLTSNAGNVVCDDANIRLTANRNSGFEGGRYRFERSTNNGSSWFFVYQGTRNYIDVNTNQLSNSRYRVASVSTDGCLGEDDDYTELDLSGVTIAESFSGSIPVSTQGACIGTTGGSLTYEGEDLGVGVNVELSVQRLNSSGNYVSAGQPTVNVEDTDTYTFDGLSSGTYRINVTVLTPGTGGVIGSCTSSRLNIAVNELNPPIISSTTVTSPLCGGSVGSIFVRA